MGREKRYKFSETVINKLQDYKKYLSKNKYSEGTIAGYKTKAGIFLQWLEDRGELVEEVNYHIIKDFVLESREEHSIKQINLILIAIKHYYKSLELGINPASGIQQRGTDRSLRHYFISYEDLEEVYQQYEVKEDRDFRNKVMLGIMVYQGVLIGELKRIKEEHIMLRQGTITIIGHQRSKNRTLQLSSIQLLDLQEYLLKVRPRMLALIRNGKVLVKAGRKPSKLDPKIKEQVFFSELGSSNIKNSLRFLFLAVQEINPKITCGKVIRSTVIIHWLKTQDVRMVQYMAGHKFVSSTEKYQAFNFEELEEELKNYHPLR